MHKKKVLFIDRDGTIIIEPPTDRQVDSLEKLEFLPGAITYLNKIATETDFELVMVTNQDGLGTDSFPENTFWPAHTKMLQTLNNEGVSFTNVYIDRSFEYENLPTRKPGTAMLSFYIDNPEYDLINSYVIGDRSTDIVLAMNLGSKAICIGKDASGVAKYVSTWKEIYEAIKMPERKAIIIRNTNETKISIQLNLDGSGQCHIKTGLGFFDHMLEQLGRHGNIDLEIVVEGDLHIDEHHTIEDTALALGSAFNQALGDKLGMMRYGFVLPMDDVLAQVAIDFGGRPWLVWDAQFKREKIGEMPTEMFFHFFKSFSDNARCNLNIIATGDNEHHKIEAIFKGFAKSIKMAVARNTKEMNILPSTKGTL